MKTITEIKAKRSFAGPGMYGYDAEATVVDETGKEVYVHVNAYDSFRHYTVQKESIWDFMAGNVEVDTNDMEKMPFFGDPDFDEKLKELDGDEPDGNDTKRIEEYGRLSDAKGSEYYKVFEALNKSIALMEKGVE